MFSSVTLPHSSYLLSVAVCFVPLPLDVRFSESFQLQGALPSDPLTRGSTLDAAGNYAPRPPLYRLAARARHGQGPSTFLSKFTPMNFFI